MMQQSASIAQAQATMAAPVERPRTTLQMKATVSAPVAGEILREAGVQVQDEQVAEPPLDTWVTDDITKPAAQETGNTHLIKAQQMQPGEQEQSARAEDGEGGARGQPRRARAHGAASDRRRQPRRTGRGAASAEDAARRGDAPGALAQAKKGPVHVMAGKATYDESDKARLYVVLAANDGNVKRTARETGVPESTVRRFKKMFEEEGPPDMKLFRQELNTFVSDADRVRFKALHRIEELIPTRRRSTS
jgi:hypothetical protein